MSAQSGSIRAGDDDWHRLGPRPHTLPRLVILEFRFWHKHGPRGKSPPKWLLFPCRFKLRLRSSEDLTWRLLCRRSSPRYTTNRPKKGTSPSIVGRLPSYSFRFTTCFFADRIPQFDPTRDRAELLLDAIALRNPDRRAATPHTLPKPAPRLYMPWTCGSRI